MICFPSKWPMRTSVTAQVCDNQLYYYAYGLTQFITSNNLKKGVNVVTLKN